MTIGSSTLLAIAASALATLVWWLINGRARVFLPVLAQFLFGLILILVLLVGPLVRLP